MKRIVNKLAAGLFLVPLFLCGATAATAAGDPGYTVSDCQLMDEPYRDAKPTAALPEGADVQILKRKGGWLNVEFGDKAGWVRMSKIRKGTASDDPDGATELGGVFNLATGRAGTGNVVATTGVRGLGEEELTNAQFNAAETAKLETFVVTDEQASLFAKEGELVVQEVAFISAPVDTSSKKNKKNKRNKRRR